ncbi:MAG: Hsp20/alpha crystallin family protein [Pseudobdellovibrionaceae bacterium]
MRLLSPNWPTRRTTSANDIFSEMEKIFAGIDRATAAPPQKPEAFIPHWEVSETEEHYLMAMDLPGVKKEDIKIEMNQDILSIAGERKIEGTVRSFNQKFSLPNTVDANKIEARHEDGVLNLYIPKTTVTKARKIEIQSKNGGFFDKLLGNNKEAKETSTNDSPSH